MGEHETTSFASKPPRFTHTPLRDAGNQIRLLRFDHGYDPDEIHLSISTWPFYYAPPYVAASYAWGSPRDTCEITIGERAYQIRCNCRNALLQIQAQAPDDFVWADSICINQTDLDEKAQQEGMMGDIFAKAQIVYSCIGEHANRSEDVFMMANDNALFVKKNLRNDENLDPHWTSERFEGKSSGTRKDMRASTNDWALHPRVFCKSLYHFSERPYWRRMWIVQEVFLARRCLVLCGPDCVSFDGLVALMGTCAQLGFVGRGDYESDAVFSRSAEFLNNGRDLEPRDILWRMSILLQDKSRSMKQKRPLQLLEAFNSFST
ncbi:hypothetical protein PRZ48_008920 [Zasmidium cellare]|uniref:Heterokaryon incompatibility domain-containing protein n=1 Tax=Zasmidium cellare TaxID=395010 RepID=A0ABR0EHV8_ZASCE|nr:hypothetical protein PRZ48_008920 [Zasmidium cellare]